MQSFALFMLIRVEMIFPRKLSFRCYFKVYSNYTVK